MDLKGRCVLVTGSSRGIGAGIALELASRNATVVVHGPEESDDLKACFEKVRALSPSSLMVSAELSRSAEIADLFDTIERRLGSLDVLVNNAATQNPSPILALKEVD
jgi:3-oxoacyl-[acyl-carrier protein] reductase